MAEEESKLRKHSLENSEYSALQSTVHVISANQSMMLDESRNKSPLLGQS